MGDTSKIRPNKRVIFIPGNVPSSKNSKQVSMPTTKDGRAIKKANGKRLVIVRNSKQVEEYLKIAIQSYIDMMPLFKSFVSDKEKPYQIHFGFVRNSKHKFDYINAAQIVQDQMKENGWIDDDDADEMKPHFLDYKYDKENPGVYIILV